MQNMGYLVAAYLILWIGMFGYLFWMSGALRGLRAELRDLRAAQPAATEEAPDASSAVPPVESLGR